MDEMKTIGLRLKYQVHEGVKFQMEKFPGNAVGIITWLGENFIALTSGQKITVGKYDISREGEGLENSVLIVFKCPISGSTVIAVPGDWIVWDPTGGYKIYTDEAIARIYNPVLPELTVPPEVEGICDNGATAISISEPVEDIPCQEEGCLCQRCVDRVENCDRCSECRKVHPNDFKVVYDCKMFTPKEETPGGNLFGYCPPDLQHFMH